MSVTNFCLRGYADNTNVLRDILGIVDIGPTNKKAATEVNFVSTFMSPTKDILTRKVRRGVHCTQCTKKRKRRRRW